MKDAEEAKEVKEAKKAKGAEEAEEAKVKIKKARDESRAFFYYPSGK